MKERLQLSDPVPGTDHRWAAVQIMHELYFVELRVLKRAEFCRQAPEHSDKPELRTRHVNDDAELRLLREVKAILGFPLQIVERASRPDEQAVQTEMTVRSGCEVAYRFCCGERLTQHATASQEMFHPWHGAICKCLTRNRLEAFQATPFNQVVAKLSKSKCILVITEPMP